MTQRLGARVERAEAIIAAGDWNGGFEAYRMILQEEILRQPGFSFVGMASRNLVLVMNRFGDLAAMAGLTEVALGVYPAVAANGGGELRVAALAKLLQMTSSTGAAGAPAVFRQMEKTLWNGAMPDAESEEPRWSAGFECETRALVCLGLGSFFNSQRWLPQSEAWLRSGVALFDADARERMGLIPLRLALANHFLTIGDLSGADTELARAEAEIDAMSGGETYRMWLEDAGARVALTRGDLARALQRLGEVEAGARKRSLGGTLCRSLLLRAEVMVLLNQLEAVDECVDSCDRLPEQVWTPDLRAERARVLRYRRLRAGLFTLVSPGSSVRDIQEGEVWENAEKAAPVVVDPTEEIAWTGDALRDYLRREAQVLEALDAMTRAGKDDRWIDRVLTALEDLEQDFGELPSRLMRARLRLTTGIVRQGTGGSDTADLEQARVLFAEAGAKHGVWVATEYLIAANAQPTEALLRENERRLDELSAGLGGEEKAHFELNKYRVREWALRSRVREVLNLRAAALPERGWWRHIPQRVRFLKALDQLVRDLDQEKLDRRPAPGAEAKGRGVWAHLISRLLFQDRGELTTGYVVLPDSTLCWWSGRWRFDCMALPINRLRVREMQREFHSALVGDERQFRRIAQQVSMETGLQSILSPVSRRVKRLAVITDEMATLPFAALRIKNAAGGIQFLAERFAVRVSDLSLEPRRPAGVDRPEAMSAFYMGGLAGDPVLTRAQDAATRASRWFTEYWGSESDVTGDAAECLRKLPQAAGFFYFGHGEFGDSRETGLGFAGAQGRVTLSVRDLQSCSFTGLEQASLFACRGADAVVARGRWEAGLVPLLRRLGVRSVLASIWQADEELAAELAGRFMTRAESVGRTAALQEFQKEKIGENRHSDPIYWAAFQIYGDGGVPRLPRRKRGDQ